MTQAVAGEALADAEVRPGELMAVGITNQRETVCVWDPRPASRCTGRSCGRTAARPSAARSCAQPVTKSSCARARASCSTPTSRRTKIEWLLRNVDGLRERAQRRTGRVRHDRRVADLQAERRARDRPLERLAHDALRHRRRMLGSASCWRCSTSPSGRCRAWRPSAGTLGTDAPARRCTVTPCRSRASRATSRRRCSARRAWTRAWARTRTGPARSRC